MPCWNQGEHCITAERGIRSEPYDYRRHDRKSNIKLFHMWKSELRNVTTNWEYGYLIDRLRTEQNKSRAKIHEIKECKLERLRDEKNLKLNNLDTGSFDNNHDNDFEEFYRSRAERTKRRHQNRRKSRQHKERKAKDRNKRKKIKAR